MKSRIIRILSASAIMCIAAASPIAKAKTPSADVLYKTAYDAVINATKANNQSSINAARKAITALKGTGAQWAIGEFSKQVDAPQQKLYGNFI